MSDSINLNLETLQQTPAAVAAGFIIGKGDGKGSVIPTGHRMVKIAEKKIGKGKGKTVAFSIIPFIQTAEYQENFTAVLPMLNELCEELQKDIATRMQRDGIAAIVPSDISIPACILEWTNRTFSAETVGAWFDTEVADMLALQILTAKGWDAMVIAECQNALNNNNLLNWAKENGHTKDAADIREQLKYLETKCAAYRASYVETASKFPSLNPGQCAELTRVIDLLELNGPIVSRIKDKIVPKDTNSSLGF
jgi:hypothetical protein